MHLAILIRIEREIEPLFVFVTMFSSVSIWLIVNQGIVILKLCLCYLLVFLRFSTLSDRKFVDNEREVSFRTWVFAPVSMLPEICLWSLHCSFCRTHCPKLQQLAVAKAKVCS